VVLMVDVRCIRRIRNAEEFKKDLITELCAVISFSAIQNNDKIGVIFFSDQVGKVHTAEEGLRHTSSYHQRLIEFQPKHKKDRHQRGASVTSPCNKRRSASRLLISDFHGCSVSGCLENSGTEA